MSNFNPFRLANGQICCSDEHALCDSCKSKHAARGHRSASPRLATVAPLNDSYSIDVAKLRASNARAEGVPDYPAIRAAAAQAIRHDVNTVPDIYAADVARMREEYARDRQ